jgi:hypothetical protein
VSRSTAATASDLPEPSGLGARQLECATMPNLPPIEDTRLSVAPMMDWTAKDKFPKKFK